MSAIGISLETLWNMRSLTSTPCIFNSIYTYANGIQTIQVEEDRQAKLMTNYTFGNWRVRFQLNSLISHTYPVSDKLSQDTEEGEKQQKRRKIEVTCTCEIMWIMKKRQKKKSDRQRKKIICFQVTERERKILPHLYLPRPFTIQTQINLYSAPQLSDLSMLWESNRGTFRCPR